MVEIGPGAAVFGAHSAVLGVDLEAFERRVADGTPETLDRALAQYRGPFLEGMADCGEAYEMWPAPQAFCNTPAFLAAAHAHLGQLEQG
ncbi:hypothetical protein [Halomonas cerina]|uniref:Uncharacterized protein n=1 Tax=Halomonas cerina TaxID=447424 RepID=A0A839VAG8_9GAMM|nr:hypothetical protein [Halomonas cerina]MBB3192482.1 hypothetical protein [Halomonas cerina]